MRYQEGVVTGKVKTEPDSQGRVRLEFPWLQQSFLSNWAPVVVGLAGPERGSWIMPELEDEVLVAFEQGDFDHPYVVGFLWNGGQRPPETDRQNRILKTPGLHELRFEDKDGSKRIIIKTPGGHTLAFSEASGEPNISLRSNAGHRLEIDDNAKTLTVRTNGNHAVILNDDANEVTLEISGGAAQMKLAQSDSSLELTGGGRKIALRDSKIAMT